MFRRLTAAVLAFALATPSLALAAPERVARSAAHEHRAQPHHVVPGPKFHPGFHISPLEAPRREPHRTQTPAEIQRPLQNVHEVTRVLERGCVGSAAPDCVQEALLRIVDPTKNQGVTLSKITAMEAAEAHRHLQQLASQAMRSVRDTHTVRMTVTSADGTATRQRFAVQNTAFDDVEHALSARDLSSFQMVSLKQTLAANPTTARVVDEHTAPTRSDVGGRPTKIAQGAAKDVRAALAH